MSKKGFAFRLWFYEIVFIIKKMYKLKKITLIEVSYFLYLTCKIDALRIILPVSDKVIGDWCLKFKKKRLMISLVK